MDPSLSVTARSGTGMLAVFVDLASQDQAGFRPWLTSEMFPPRMAIGFFAGASYDLMSGDGPEFATLYDAPSLGNLYGEPYQGLRRVRSPMDAAYHEKFRDQERYTLGWTGPELSLDMKTPDRRLAPYIHVDRFDLDDAASQAFNIGLACSYLPGLARMPGVMRVRRYLTMEGPRSHVLLHEFSNPNVTESLDWLALRRDWGAGLTQMRSGLYQRAAHSS